MIIKKYNVVFNGFWRYEIRNKLPQNAGLLFVYRGVRLEQNGQYFCDLKEILYICKASNLCEEASKNDISQIQASLKTPEILYFSCCELPIEKQNDIYDAFVHVIQPRINLKKQNEGNQDKKDTLKQIQIISSGKISLFENDITTEF